MPPARAPRPRMRTSRATRLRDADFLVELLATGRLTDPARCGRSSATSETPETPETPEGSACFIETARRSNRSVTPSLTSSHALVSSRWRTVPKRPDEVTTLSPTASELLKARIALVRRLLVKKSQPSSRSGSPRISRPPYPEPAVSAAGARFPIVPITNSVLRSSVPGSRRRPRCAWMPAERPEAPESAARAAGVPAGVYGRTRSLSERARRIGEPVRPVASGARMPSRTCTARVRVSPETSATDLVDGQGR